MNTTSYSSASVSLVAKAAAAVSCAVITLALFNGVASLAQPGRTQAADLALARATVVQPAPVRLVAMANGSTSVR